MVPATLTLTCPPLTVTAAGLFDDKSGPGVIDDKADLTVARQIADEGVVLLKNSGGVLPLAKTASKIAVIGGYANLGVLSGGGSSQVVPKAPYRTIPMGGEGSMAQFRNMLLDPSAPLAAMRRAAHEAKIVWNDGRYISAAVAAAKDADIVVVFATQWSGEGEDQPDLTLPNGQDALIAAVAAANPKTVVVLETGGPVLMPWLDKAAAVVEAWYPGAQGGEAIADVLFGDVDASGRLPMTFPASIDQYPRAELPGLNLGEGVKFDVPYTEGADIGYRRFAANGAKPLFPFGFGLSYAHFTYSGLKVNAGKSVSVTFTVTNDSKRDGKDAPQVYVKSLAGQPALRLIAFDKLSLKAGESRTVTLPVDPRLLAHFDVKAHGWSLAAGDYEVAVGHAASDLSLSATARLGAQKLKP